MMAFLARLLPYRVRFGFLDAVYEVVGAAHRHRSLKKKGEPSQELAADAYLPPVLLRFDQRLAALEAEIAALKLRQANSGKVVNSGAESTDAPN